MYLIPSGHDLTNRRAKWFLKVTKLFDIFQNYNGTVVDIVPESVMFSIYIPILWSVCNQIYTEV